MTKSDLEKKIESLLKENLDQQLKLDSQNLKIKLLEEQNDYLTDDNKLLRSKLFGTSSEKKILDRETGAIQFSLFDEAESLARTFGLKPECENDAIEANEQNKEEPNKKPHSKGGRKKFPSYLTRKEYFVDLLDSEKFCPHGHALSLIGNETAERLDVRPAHIEVLVTVRPKYACTVCKDCVRIADVEPTILPKVMVTEGTVATMAVMKYLDHLPLYRIETMFSRHEVKIGRGTMASYMITLGEALTPLLNLLNDELLSSPYIHMDETHVQVLNEEGKTAESKSYMWVRARSGEKPIVLYEYASNRSGKVATELLEGFSGYLQVDGYGGYDPISRKENITRIGCFAHARRKFTDVLRGNKKNTVAAYFIKMIAKLYKVEKELREDPSLDRYEYRKKHSEEILNEIKIKCDEYLLKVAPKSEIAKALKYLQNEWAHSIVFMSDGKLEIDNNFVENKIRPFAIGRKNWLFSAEVEGAKASASIYSLLLTAIENNQEPRAYLEEVIKGLATAKVIEDYEALLPWNLEKTKLRTPVVR